MTTPSLLLSCPRNYKGTTSLRGPHSVTQSPLGLNISRQVLHAHREVRLNSSLGSIVTPRLLLWQD
ncbi:hypothetical protein E2C01_011358 [Portunus trituberculatus]|uniref:Uncharacterized protein n=1 Tax=Portunus trituberculatus TaxID=210409 RepID=A0A5B7DAT6_PORTR|nr:hypothetical protein [Portunus trituberculatus]